VRPCTKSWLGLGVACCLVKHASGRGAVVMCVDTWQLREVMRCVTARIGRPGQRVWRA
jgi:hypothetical protein